MTIISSRYKPSWWYRNKHLQTFYPTVFRKRVSIELQSEQLDLPDGDFVDLCWTPNNQAGPIVILFHGLEGSINSPYAKGILKAIYDSGWQGVLMHFRGCSGRHNRLDRSYHSGDTGDIEFFINTLKSRYPNRKLAAIGISLGGNALLKYLGEKQDESNLDAAMAVSVPFDLADSAKQLNKGFARVYQHHLVSRLRNKMIDKFKQKPAPVDIDKLSEWTDFYSFDHNVTAPIHGFKSADDYYTRSSSKQFLKYIKTPTLILHSKDDPFMSNKAIPKEDEISDAVTLELTEQGGHVGFIYGKPNNPTYWVEKRLADFFSRQLN